MNQTTLTGILLDERVELSLDDLSDACSGSTEWVMELVDEGVLDPIGDERTRWRFQAISVHKARAAKRLQHDLGINLAGAALALDLLEEIDALRERLRRYEAEDDA